MTIIRDALRQAFMPKREYVTLREEEKVWDRLQKPLIFMFLGFVCIVVSVSVSMSLKIVFSSEMGKRPFCQGTKKIQPLSINTENAGRNSYLLPEASDMTEKPVIDYYWSFVFIPSSIIFVFSTVHLVAGFVILYASPSRHWCLRVLENNDCDSGRCGVRCLSIINATFAVLFGLLAVFFGFRLLAWESGCAVWLFSLYEVCSWGLVVLYSVTAILLKKAAILLDEDDFHGRNLELEMLKSQPLEVTPEVQRRVHEGFNLWMGSSFLSSDDEDDAAPDGYFQAPSPQLMEP